MKCPWSALGIAAAAYLAAAKAAALQEQAQTHPPTH